MIRKDDKGRIIQCNIDKLCTICNKTTQHNVYALSKTRCNICGIIQIQL